MEVRETSEKIPADGQGADHTLPFADKSEAGQDHVESIDVVRELRKASRQCRRVQGDVEAHRCAVDTRMDAEIVARPEGLQSRDSLLERVEKAAGVLVLNGRVVWAAARACAHICVIVSGVCTGTPKN